MHLVWFLNWRYTPKIDHFNRLSMSRVVKQLKYINKISSTTIKPQVVLDSTKYNGLNLTFQVQNFNGHMGARKFWHEYLPTLQFYNPSLPINVSRIKNEDKKVTVPCLLEVLAADGTVAEKISMKDKASSEIMDEFLSKVEHTRVPEEEVVKV